MPMGKQVRSLGRGGRRILPGAYAGTRGKEMYRISLSYHTGTGAGSGSVDARPVPVPVPVPVCGNRYRRGVER
jgi:hypothetical protein